MELEQVIHRLKVHERELRIQGVSRLSVFGSVARGCGDAVSDIDLAVELVPDRVVGVTGLGRIQKRLEDILGVAVDLVEEPVRRKPALQHEIDETRVAAF